MPYIGNQGIGSYTSMSKQDITGVTGNPVKRGFVLSYAVANSFELAVFVNNIRQEPTTAYSASGTVLTMTGDVETTDSFYVIYIGKAIGTINPPDGSVGTAQIAAGSGILTTEWQSVVTASTLTAVAGKGYWINTTSNSCLVTLPSSASVGDSISIVDYAGTFATNKITLTSSLKIEGGTGNKDVTTNREGVAITYADTTQGWVATAGVNSGTQAIDPATTTIDFLVIGGGASGGTYTGATGYAPGNSGSDSSISGSTLTTITSAGGGRGAGYNGGGSVFSQGGSGGGGSSPSGVGGSGNTPSTSPSQGNSGGNGATGGNLHSGGGGGGAGAVGQAGVAGTAGAGDGGNGLSSSITGSAVTRAGGGGGCMGNTVTSQGAGGTGGGGAGGGASSSPVGGVDGALNTGSGGGAGDNGGAGHGGGGAGGYRTSTQTLTPGKTITIAVGDGGATVGVSGAGGKGVVILSMPDAGYTGTITGSPTVATGVSGKTILTFTGTGSYVT
jgi:hypothetical protein